VVDPLTPSTLYVAAGSGLSANFLKSQDGGQSWNVIYPNAGPLYNLPTNLVMDPSNPSTLYRVNPLLKSTDGGVSWTRFADPIPLFSALTLAVDPRDSNTLYVSTIQDTAPGVSVPDIFKSTDGGRSWNALNTTVPAVQTLVFSPSHAMFAGTSSGVFESADAGSNWGQTSAGLSVVDIEVLAGDPLNPATVYAGGNSGLFKSLDGGGSCSPLAAPSGPMRSLLIDFTNPNVLYLQPSGASVCYPTVGELDLYKSTNGGAGWSNISSHSLVSGCQAETPAMTMDPIDANTLYLPYGDDWYGFTVLKSADGGAGWTNLGGAGLGDASYISTLAIDLHAPTNLYVATDVGVFRSTDGGVNFAPAGFANTLVVRLVIDPIHPGVLYAATSGSYPGGFSELYKSVDSGASWSPINQGLDQIVAVHAPVNALLVDPARADVLYLATSGYGVFRSTDGGANWAAFNDGLTFLDVRSLALSRRDPAAPCGGRSGVLGSNTLYAGTPGGVFKIE
jgi:photosystem II stability/assembly factor-like uncharacterized protein